MRECLRVCSRVKNLSACVRILGHCRLDVRSIEIAEGIRASSAYQEEELLIPMNSSFAVQGSLSSADAALL
jgi:hypothetical protein